MSSQNPEEIYLARLRASTRAMSALESKLAAWQNARHEPIAVIGMSCRFPKADSIEAYWRNLVEGRNCVSRVPAERWDVDSLYDPDPEAPGKTSARFGGFLDRFAEFDADFFGISPREAQRMDPQQRLLLETAWEALERAALSPDATRGRQVGVFVGVCASEYSRLQFRDLRSLDAYAGSGTALSIAANRLSYFFDWKGPSVALDTACSSSLVAIHLACASLRGAESELALVCGSNLLLAAESFITFSKARMLAPDGKCKVFDARADGYVRGEGVGAVVLKKLSSALRDGDPIEAVIRGSAVNQDGATNGLTAPNAFAQADVLRKALADARLEASDISYVEAHGTGTSLGDPIEMDALIEVYGKPGIESTACTVGSVKTNLGHLEGAAGIAGFIKAALATKHGVLPAHLHFRSLNPNIELAGTRLAIHGETQDWNRDPPNRPRRAAVSSFGFGGTNAHVIVEEPPPPSAAFAWPTDKPDVLLLSARTEGALREQAERWRTELAQCSDDARSAWSLTAAVGRARFPQRLAAIGRDRAALCGALAAFLERKPHPGLLHGAAEEAPKLAFLFTGQGSHYAGLARELYEAEPAFRESMARARAVLDEELGRELQALLCSSTSTATAWERTDFAQPALFAIQAGIADLLASYGVRPDIVCGHSVGELAAAYVSGIWSFEDGLRFAATRGRLMQALPDDGAMAVVTASGPDVEAQLPGDVDIAARNGPRQTLISGPREAVMRTCKRMADAGFSTSLSPASRAFHSRQMEPALEALQRAAATVPRVRAQIAFVSGTSGALDPAALLHDSYFADQARRPVEFSRALATLHAERANLFLEIGPQPTLLGLVAAAAGARKVVTIPTLRKGQSDVLQLRRALAALEVHGRSVDWCRVYGVERFQRIVAPTYPFERSRYLLLDQPSMQNAGAPTGHPLLGRRLRTAVPLFESELSTALPVIASHRVNGRALLPAAVYVELALAASESDVLEDLQILHPLTVPDAGSVTLQTLVTREPHGARVEIHHCHGDGFTCLAHARARGAAIAREQPAISADQLAASCPEVRSPEELYQRLQDHGFTQVARPIVQLRRGERSAWAQLQLATSDRAPDAVRLDPELLSAALQVIGAALPDERAEQSYLVCGVRAIRVRKVARPRSAFVRVEVESLAPSEICVKVQLADEDGAALCELEGVSLRAPRAEVSATLADHLYDVRWISAPVGAEAAALASPRDAATSGRARLAALLAGADLAAQRELAHALDRLSSALVAFAWHRLELGSSVAPGAAAGVLPKYRRLVQCCSAMLSDAPPPGSHGELALELTRRHPDATPIVELLVRCGESLPLVLVGKADPLELLFPGGSTALVENLYRNLPLSRVSNQVIEAVLEHIAARASEGASLRILEIGAGTGSATHGILERISERVSEYIFTDISAHFLASAKERFSAYECVTYQTLDVERDPSEQGFAGRSFDIVIAANVLHTTADLARTLAHIERLLVPGGLLVMLESMAKTRWIDLTFGLTDGWWRFSDAPLRTEHPLIGVDAWRSLLARQGFSESAVVHDARVGEQAVWIAKKTSAEQFVLVMDDDDDFGARLRDRLIDAGHAAVTVSRAPNAKLQLEQALAPSGSGLCKVIHLGGLSEQQDDEEATADALMDVERSATASLLATAQTLAARLGRTRLYSLTRRAQSLPGDAVVAPAQNAVWGLGRAIAREHPELHCTRIDVDDASLDALTKLLTHDDGEDENALRAGQRWISRLHNVSLPSSPATLRSDATYLVTGGLGGIGLEVGHWLARSGAGQIVLVGRRAPDATIEARLAQIRATGANVVWKQVDVSERSQLEALLSEIERTLPPLRGVFHLSAVLDDGMLATLDWARFRPVLAAKALAALHLHALTQHLPLEHFALFSSASAVLGTPGMGNYVAANAFLEGLARYRVSRGLPAIAVHWGVWQGVGMAMRSRFTDVAGATRAGAGSFTSEQALDVLGRLLASDCTQVCPLPVQSHQWRLLFPNSGDIRLLSDLTAPAASERPAGTSAAPHVHDIRNLAPEARGEALASFLDALISQVLQRDGDSIDRRRGFAQMGIDSLMTVELKRSIERALQVQLTSTFVFNHPTIEALALHLSELLFPDAAAPVAETPANTSESTITAIAALSDDQIAAMIERELAGMAGEKLP